MSKIVQCQEFEQLSNFIGIRKMAYHDAFHCYEFSDIYDRSKGVNTPLIRSDFYDLTLFIDIEFTWQYAYSSYQIKGGMLQIVPMRQVCQVIVDGETLSKAQGITLNFKPEFIASVINISNFHQDFPFFSFANMDVAWQLEGAEMEVVLLLFRKIQYEYKKGDRQSMHIIKGYLLALLHTINRINCERPLSEKEKLPSLNRETVIANQYQELVFQHTPDIRTVNEYADMLYISPKHLSDTLKQATGKTAISYIHEALILEAKVQLKKTTKSISQVAYDMNFQDTSNFTKFFKKETGITPTDFKLLMV